jgi:hypothetical protein
MAFSIHTSAKYIRVIYSGTLTNTDIQGVLKDSIGVSGNELNLINRIEDMRELHGIKIGFDELMDFTSYLRTIQMPHTVKTAILTGNTLQYGIARMFQTILEHPQMDIKIFSNEEEARTWVAALD